MSVSASGADAEEAVSEAAEEIKRLDKLWSAENEDGEIYKVNHESPCKVGEDTAEILRMSQEMSELTSGAFDITMYPLMKEWGFADGDYKIPSEERLNELLKSAGYEKVTISEDNTVSLPKGTQIELGAIGKGYAGDRACETLREKGIESALLSLGGGIHLIGGNLDGKDWKIALKDPFEEGNFGTLLLSDCSVITSGGYERYFVGDDGKRYCHILNPETGKPVENELSSAVIISETGAYGDALSTAVFVMGTEKAVNLWRENGGFEMILVTNDKEIFITENIEKSFSINNDKDFKIITIKKQP